MNDEAPAHDPWARFHRWYAEAAAPKDVMSLATATRDGRPSNRMVSFKGIDEGGFVFVTHYESRKGRELTENPDAALVFFWASRRRQVRVEGEVRRLSAAASDALFAARPLARRLSAWASPQSRVIESRRVLETRVDELAREYHGRAVPRPPFWGGFVVVPESMEFREGREDRLADRRLYARVGRGWTIRLLAP